MGADAVHVFYGVRYVVQSDEELAAIERRADQRLERARKVKLKTCLGRVTDGEPHFLLIGYHLGTFGVENDAAAGLTAAEVSQIIEETRRRLQQGGFEPAEARLYFQLEAQY